MATVAENHADEAIASPCHPCWPVARNGLPPAIVLDGRINAVSIIRSLARMGVEVHALGVANSAAKRSRYARWISPSSAGKPAAAWADFLFGRDSDHLRGAVLLAAGDIALEVLIAHRAALAERFRLDEVNPDAQRQMLDKLGTYRAAGEAGVPTPRFWLAHSIEHVESLRDELIFPLLVKPTISHLFERQFGAKHLTAENYGDLLAALSKVRGGDSQVMLVEKIPGPDDRLCSYYTYLDGDGAPQFHFTKRIIRRYPIGQGNACYHVTDFNPEVRDLALKLFQHVGLRGLANVEFKRDDRDGRLKLIECNARFTASDCLIARSGFNLSRYVYKRIVGLPPEPMSTYRRGLRLWYPLDDFLAFRELRRRGEITTWQWLSSIAHRQTFPLFQLRDPLPSLAIEGNRVKRFARRLFGKKS
jgi:predicted ATP-grasp superfamily ATP-dependent carboligase